MTIGSILPWFGSKRTLAPRIVEVIGPHASYWEPFCGSMAVLMAKSAVAHECVNDLHGELINLACVIQSPVDGPAFYRKCRRMWVSEQMHASAVEMAGTMESNLGRACQFFYSSWIGRNGTAGTSETKKNSQKHFAVRWTQGGGHNGTRWRSAVNSIPAWRRRMAGVSILNRDGFEVIEKIEDQVGSAIYLDPPYVAKGAKYLHDFDEKDHARLAALVGRFKHARVVISYYDHPRVRELYAGWNFIPCGVTKGLSQGNSKRGTKEPVTAPEILIVNGKVGLF